MSAGYYLKGSSCIVKPVSFNMENKTLEMELYDTNLSEWIRKGNMTHTDKLSVLQNILIGLTEIHERGLTHADIKSSNILIKYHPLKAVIGDLGFVSLSKFAKVERTARTYRDLKIQHKPTHDMFSLGIVIIELFGNFRFEEQPDKKQIGNLTSHIFKNSGLPKTNELRTIVLNLTQENYNKRLSSKEVLYQLFNKKNEVVLSSVEYPLLQNDEVQKWMKSVAKEWKIQRAKRGYKILLHYVHNNKKEKDIILYSSAMLVILSSIFGKSGFKDQRGLDACNDYFKDNLHHKKYSMKDILSCISDLINNHEVITTIFLP